MGQKLSKLTQEETENLKRSIAGNWVNNFKTLNKEKLWIKWFQWWILLNIKREIKANLSQTLTKKEKKQKEEIALNSCYETSMTLIPKPDKDYKKENYRITSLMNINTKNLNKNLAIWSKNM